MAGPFLDLDTEAQWALDDAGSYIHIESYFQRLVIDAVKSCNCCPYPAIDLHRRIHFLVDCGVAHGPCQYGPS